MCKHLEAQFSPIRVAPQMAPGLPSLNPYTPLLSLHQGDGARSERPRSCRKPLAPLQETNPFHASRPAPCIQMMLIKPNAMESAEEEIINLGPLEAKLDRRYSSWRLCMLEDRCKPSRMGLLNDWQLCGLSICQPPATPGLAA